MPDQTPEAVHPLPYFPEVGDSWLPVVRWGMWATVAHAAMQVAGFILNFLPIRLMIGSPSVSRFRTMTNWEAWLIPTLIQVTAVIAWGVAAVCCLMRVRGARGFYVTTGIVYVIVSWLAGSYFIATNAGRFGFVSDVLLSNLLHMLGNAVLPVLLVVLMMQRSVRRITDEFRM